MDRASTRTRGSGPWIQKASRGLATGSQFGYRLSLMLRSSKAVCASTENTASGDFVIDRHPDHDNLWIAGGGSGHGFKHGPAVGEYLARLISTGMPPEARFALPAAKAAGQRVVH